MSLSRDLENILAEYISAEEAGAVPGRAAFLARYPEHAAELREFFANRDQIQHLIGPLKGTETTPDCNGHPAGDTRCFGDYELLGHIAAGGMGVVYKARQISLNRIVAVKMILKGPLATEDEVKRFRSEAEAAANLLHPGIAAIHEVGQHEGQHYFSMDFVDGLSLAQQIRNQPLSPRKAAEYLREAAEAVHYAHQQGTLHRDLKPSNIMIDSQDRVRITDFGLAKRIDGTSDLTQTGQILGTPSYMAPEQALGKRWAVAAESDIYSLGAVLYELLVGRPPFRGESAVETLKQVETLDPVLPQALNPATPADLETICLKCLEKEPNNRYGSAQLLADDLGRFLRGEMIEARPVGRVERAGRWCRRNPVVAGLGTAVVVALVSGIAVSSYFAVRANAFGVEANSRASEATAERERAETYAERARRQLYVSDMNLAQQSWQEGNVGRVLELLAAHEPTADKQDLRSWEWGYLWNLCHNDLRTLKGHVGGVQSVVFSSDGKRIASGSDDYTIKVWDAERGTELATLRGHAFGVRSISFSPDGKRIASGSDDRTVTLWDADRGTALATLNGHDSAVHCVAFSPDGKRIASGSDDQSIKLWDAENGTGVATFKGHAGRVQCVAFSSDGKRIVSGSWDCTVKIWDAENGTQLSALKGHVNPIASVAFSPDGKRIASGSSDDAIKLWDMESGAELATRQLHSGSAHSFAFSPDGKQIAMGSGDGVIKLLDAENGTDLATLRGHTNCVRAIVFSPDAKLIASGGDDQTIKLWSAERGSDLSMLKDTSTHVLSITFSPDGTRIATGSSDKSVRLWDAEGGTQLAALNSHRGTVVSVAYSPDGKRVASGSTDHTVHLWDAESGVRLLTLIGHGDTVRSVAFSPDGRRIASGSADRTIKVWDAARGTDLATIKGHADSVYSVAFGPDGKRIASASRDHTVKLWNAESGAELATFEGHASEVSGVAFSPDENLIVSGSDDHTVKLWDTKDGTEVATLKGHAGRVQSVVFSPDGRRIASGSSDGTVKLWDVENRAELATLKGRSGQILSVAFSPDGNRLAGAANYTVQIYNATVLPEDEKMARFRVDHFFKEMSSSEEIIAAIQSVNNWDVGMRKAALAYAQSRAKVRQISNGGSTNPSP